MVLEGIRRRLGGAVEHFGLSSSQFLAVGEMDDDKRGLQEEKQK